MKPSVHRYCEQMNGAVAVRTTLPLYTHLGLSRPSRRHARIQAESVPYCGIAILAPYYVDSNKCVHIFYWTRTAASVWTAQGHSPGSGLSLGARHRVSSRPATTILEPRATGMVWAPHLGGHGGHSGARAGTAVKLAVRPRSHSRVRSGGWEKM